MVCIIFNVQVIMVGINAGLVILSAAMILIAGVIMARVIIKGHRSANMIPWLIWAAVTASTWCALHNTQATWWEQMVPASQLFSMFIIMLATAFVLCKHGGWRKERIKKTDWRVLAVCSVCMVVGILFNNPYITLWGNFGANLVGLTPLLIEGRADPAGIPRGYWIFRGLSTVLATAACIVGSGLSYAVLIGLGAGWIIVGAMLWESIQWQPRQTRSAQNKVYSVVARNPLLAGILFR